MLHCDVQADQKPGWVCGVITVSLYKDIEDSWAVPGQVIKITMLCKPRPDDNTAIVFEDILD